MGKLSTNSAFPEELIFLDHAFQDCDDFFDFVYPTLIDKGYVKNSFLASIKSREQTYPTGLPTAPYVIALPHTDIEHIIKPFISVTRVKGTVKWHEMANNDQILDAKFIFLLGFTEKNGHINLLQTLMTCFEDASFLTALYQTQNCHEFIQLLNLNVKL